MTEAANCTGRHCHFCGQSTSVADENRRPSPPHWLATASGSPVPTVDPVGVVAGRPGRTPSSISAWPPRTAPNRSQSTGFSHRSSRELSETTADILSQLSLSSPTGVIRRLLVWARSPFRPGRVTARSRAIAPLCAAQPQPLGQHNNRATPPCRQPLRATDHAADSFKYLAEYPMNTGFLLHLLSDGL